MSSYDSFNSSYWIRDILNDAQPLRVRALSILLIGFSLGDSVSLAVTPKPFQFFLLDSIVDIGGREYMFSRKPFNSSYWIPLKNPVRWEDYQVLLSILLIGFIEGYHQVYHDQFCGLSILLIGFSLMVVVE